MSQKSSFELDISPSIWGRFNLIRTLFLYVLGDITESSRSETHGEAQTNEFKTEVYIRYLSNINHRPPTGVNISSYICKCNPDMQAQGRRRLLRAVDTRAKAIWKHLSTYWVSLPGLRVVTPFSSFIALVAAEAFTSIDYLFFYFTTFRIHGRIFFSGLPTMPISRKKGEITGLEWNPGELDNNMQRKALTGFDTSSRLARNEAPVATETLKSNPHRSSFLCLLEYLIEMF